MNLLIKSKIEFVDQYLEVGRNTYTFVGNNVKKDCNVIVDGTKDIEILANEMVTLLQMGPGE